jgi:hypothetical protein
MRTYSKSARQGRTTKEFGVFLWINASRKGLTKYLRPLEPRELVTIRELKDADCLGWVKQNPIKKPTDE